VGLVREDVAAFEKRPRFEEVAGVELVVVVEEGTVAAAERRWESSH